MIRRVKVRNVGTVTMAPNACRNCGQPIKAGDCVNCCLDRRLVLGTLRIFQRAAIDLANVMQSTRQGDGAGYPFDKPFDAVVSDLIRWADMVEGE